MNPFKVLLPSLTTILFTLACGPGNLPRPIPAGPLTETHTVTPPPTRIPIPASFPTDIRSSPVPLWVTDFADPILTAAADRKPDFQDDFSMNRGWLNLMSGIGRPLYADIQDEMLFLKLPEKRRDSILYNPKLNRRNFLLTVDLRFYHDQPNDTVRFQFDRSADQSVALDLSNNRNWKFHWGDQDDRQSMTGIYEHFPPENIPVTIIMRGAECAVYFNNDPLLYLSDCRPIPTFQSQVWVATFRLLRDTGRAVSVNFDNLNLWDLDKIPNLP